MRLLDRLRFRWRALFERRRLEAEMREEMTQHLEHSTARHVARGLDPQAARRAARIELGSLDMVAEECRESWGVKLLDELSGDLRLAGRSLRRSPGYAAAVVLTLGLGIGANTAVFSVVRGVLLKPLPFDGGERLVTLAQPVPQQGVEDLGFSVLELEDLRRGVPGLEDVVEYHSMNFTLYGGDQPLRVRAGVVSATFFDVFKVQPLHGRTFQPREDAIGAEAVLVLSWEFWQRAYGGDPTIVGRTFEMNDRPHTVVGVLPPLPDGDHNDVFMPASACPFRSDPAGLARRDRRMVAAFGKLAPGASVTHATREANAVVGRLQAEHAEAYPRGGGAEIRMAGLRDKMTAKARGTFLLLLGTVAVILLVACANVANLALARVTDRGHEIAVRAALGAGRRRLLRQFLVESTVLAVLGGTLGLGIAFATRGVLISFAARFSPRAEEIAIDGGVLLFALLISLATGLVFGSLPGMPRGERAARAVLSEAARSTAPRGHRRLRNTLVIGQLALSFVLLVAAALMLRSLWRLGEVDAGFRAENVLTAEIHLNWSSYQSAEHGFDREGIAAFHDRLGEKLGALPGVVGIGRAWTFPLNSGFASNSGFLVEGREEGARAPMRATFVGASGDYFEAIGVPLVAGRTFTGRESGEEPKSAIVSRELARRFFPGEDPVGRRISTDEGRSWRTVVAVVGDVRQSSLRDEPEPTIYLPFSEFPGFSSFVFVRSLVPPARLERELRELVMASDAQTAISDVATLETIRRDALASPRLTTLLLALFAGLALAISATGLAGVLAYSVARRTREIGIRMALGAEPRRVLRQVVAEGLRSTAAGLALGVVAALSLARLMTGLLYGISSMDTLCLVASAATLVLTSFVACLLPARRAVAVQPMTALRV